MGEGDGGRAARPDRIHYHGIMKMSMKYVCSTKRKTLVMIMNRYAETTESLWIINKHMVIHTMSVDEYGNVIKESITDPSVNPADLVYDAAKTNWV